MAPIEKRLIQKIDMCENLYHVIQDCVVFRNTILVIQDVSFCSMIPKQNVFRISL